MNKLTVIIYFIFAVTLSACSGDDGTVDIDDLVASVTCVDVYNGSTSELCNDSISVATIFIDGGTITRSTLISATLEVTNPTASDINGYAEIKFDAGCNGSDTWELMFKQPFVFSANDVYTINGGGMCSDMPLGNRTLTGTAWFEDGVTIIDEVVINFTLVE